MTETELVTDEEVATVHGNADFGRLSPRGVLREGVLKRACGYHCGFTMSSILIAHKLVTPKDERLTRKGQQYLYAAFENSIGRKS